MPQGSVHWHGTQRSACGPEANWNVQVVRGKVTTRCLWHACKALGIGLLLMLLGACMATIGYYADQLSVAQEIRGNVTVKVKNESRGFHLNNLSYAGPIVMGVGGFIVVAACVMTFEARDSAAKVVPARFRFNQGSTLKYARNQRPRRSTSSQTTKWDHQLGLFRVNKTPSPNVADASRKALTAEFVRFSKNLGDKGIQTLSLSRIIPVICSVLFNSGLLIKAQSCHKATWNTAGHLSSMCTKNSKMTQAQEFPNTLREFGYDFDEGGKLRKLDPQTGEMTDEGFDFNVSKDAQYNQKRYEALGEVINHYVYDLLEKENLKRLPVPKESTLPLDQRSFIFADDDAFTNEKLLILIHGSGVVRAGQWARRLIINDNLNSGTQVPYIRKAKELGYGVIVLNTNDNRRLVKGVMKDIKGSADPHEHMRTVWHDYVQQSAAEDIAIIAHSYGGVCTVKFATEQPEEFKKRVFAVGFTDSVHVMPAKGCNHVIQVARNWVSSKKPLDTPVDGSSNDVPCVSAGHPVHEMTSWSCIESVFKFLEERYHSRIKGKD